jgi:hypothetical protein
MKSENEPYAIPKVELDVETGQGEYTAAEIDRLVPAVAANARAGARSDRPSAVTFDRTTKEFETELRALRAKYATGQARLNALDAQVFPSLRNATRRLSFRRCFRYSAPPCSSSNRDLERADRQLSTATRHHYHTFCTWA